MRLYLVLSLLIALTIAPVRVKGQGSLSSIFSSFGSSISSALQNPGQALSSMFPQGLAGLFPFRWDGQMINFLPNHRFIRNNMLMKLFKQIMIIWFVKCSLETHFSIANLPQLPPLRLPQQMPQMMMNGMRNATLIMRQTLMNPGGATLALLAAPILPLMAIGGPANLAGMHHAVQLGFNGRMSPRMWVIASYLIWFREIFQCLTLRKNMVLEF